MKVHLVPVEFSMKMWRTSFSIVPRLKVIRCHFIGDIHAVIPINIDHILLKILTIILNQTKESLRLSTSILLICKDLCCNLFNIIS